MPPPPDPPRDPAAPFRAVMEDAEFRRLVTMPRFTEGEVTLLGAPTAFSDWFGFFHSVEEIFFGETYRFATTAARPFIVDAGASFGLSLLYFRRLHPGCTITAFEPDPDIFRLLARNVRAHGLADVELREAAAWDADATLPFHAEGSLAGSAMADYAGTARPIPVRAERLKTLLRGRDVDFLKLDIEGAEHRVLPDIAPELARVRALFFEYHSLAGAPQRLDELLRVVSAAGFRYVIKGAAAPRHPFTDPPAAAFDMQVNVFCRRD